METQTTTPNRPKKYKTYTGAQVREAKKLRKMGKTLADISVITGIPQGTLGHFAHRGIFKHKRQFAPRKRKATVTASVEKPTRLASSIRTILALMVPDTVKLITIDAIVNS